MIHFALNGRHGGVTWLINSDWFSWMDTPLVIDVELFQSVTCHTVETHIGHTADMRSNVLGQVVFERSTERTLRTYQHFLFMVRTVV